MIRFTYDRSLFNEFKELNAYPKQDKVTLLMSGFCLILQKDGHGFLDGEIPERDRKMECDLCISNIQFTIKLYDVNAGKRGPSVQNLKDQNH